MVLQCRIVLCCAVGGVGASYTSYGASFEEYLLSACLSDV